MIPFADLKTQYQSIRDEIEPAVKSVLESSEFILGRYVRAFESDFAAYCQTEQAIGVNSGTSALHLALLAIGVGPGDEVITTPFTFVATVAAIRYTGAIPVFADIDPVTFTIDPGKIESRITPKTKAIMPVHLYGQPADMDPIMEIARRHGLPVIEDAAQAHGSEYKGRRAGSIGELGCFSFYPGKNLGAYGEGGAVTTNNPEFARTIRMLRDWGQEVKYHYILKGFNYRMEGIQGAILKVKLSHLEAWTEARRANAAKYTQQLGAAIQTPQEASYGRHVFHVYAVRSPHRDRLQQALQAAGVQTGIHYPIPCHLTEAHTDLGYHRGDFPHAEKAADEVLSLPMFAELTTEQIQEVCAVIAGFKLD
jgi:dTDP-4-amino-4,6-dideoxygalactose transaminase